MNLVGRNVPLDDKRKLEINGIEVGGWGVWKWVELGGGGGEGYM